MTFSAVLATIKEERKKYDRDAIAADPIAVMRSLMKAVNQQNEDLISPIKVYQQATEFNIELIKGWFFFC